MLQPSYIITIDIYQDIIGVMTEINVGRKYYEKKIVIHPAYKLDDPDADHTMESSGIRL